LSRLLLSSEAPAHGGAAFNLSDLEKRGEALVERAKARAAEVIAEAHRQAGTIAEQAKRAGFEGGKAEGLALGREEGRKAGVEQGLAEARAATETLGKALGAVVGEVSSRRESLVRQAERDLLGLAVAVAGRIVRRELQADTGAVARAVAEAASLAAERSRVVIRVNPADLEALGAAHQDLPRLFAEIQEVRVVGDETVERGGCRLITESGEVDMRVATQLERIGRLLAGEADIDAGTHPDGGGEGGR